METTMRIFRDAVLVALIASAIAVPAAAQIPSDSDIGGVGFGGRLGGGDGARRGRYTVSGTVRESGSGTPLDQVEVKLWSLAAGLTASTMTGSGGNFAISDVPGGNYSLVVEESGYERFQEDINISSGPEMDLRVLLKRQIPFDKIGNGITVSARELAIPRRAREAMTQGLSLANDKSDYKGSIAQFQRALKEYPDYYEAYMQMGISYMKTGDNDKSEEMLRKSIDMSQHKYPEALSALAFLYSNQKRFADAEPLAREAVKLNSSSADDHLELALALYGLEHFEEAETSALESERMQPANPRIHLLLANIHVKLLNYTALIHDLDAFLQLSPNGPQADQARQMRAQVVAVLADTQSIESDEPEN